SGCLPSLYSRQAWRLSSLCISAPRIASLSPGWQSSRCLSSGRCNIVGRTVIGWSAMLRKALQRDRRNETATRNLSAVLYRRHSGSAVACTRGRLGGELSILLLEGHVVFCRNASGLSQRNRHPHDPSFSHVDRDYPA